MAIVGFLDNLSYMEQTKAYAAGKGGNFGALLRKAQDDTIQKLFAEKEISCHGPNVIDGYFPYGGWLFKISSGSEGEDLKKYVLGKLGITDSQTLGLEEYEDFTVSLGFLVRDYPNDLYPKSIDTHAGCKSEFASMFSAFLRRRQENLQLKQQYSEPYFLIMDREFTKKFPYDKEKDDIAIEF